VSSYFLSALAALLRVNNGQLNETIRCVKKLSNFLLELTYLSFFCNTLLGELSKDRDCFGRPDRREMFRAGFERGACDHMGGRARLFTNEDDPADLNS